MKIIRFIFLLAHLAIISLLLGNFLNIYVRPTVFPYFNFLSLAFPVLMILNVILILFWIILWKKRAFLFLFLSVFLVKPTSRIVNYSKKESGMSNLKIITFNVKYGRLGVDEIENFVRKENPDILFLQEAGRLKNSKFKFDQFEYHQMANIIYFYSKYKIISTKEWIKNGNAYVKSYDVEIKGKTYRFINVYLSPFYLEKSMVKPTDNRIENELKFKNLVKRMMPNFKAHQEQIVAARQAIETSPYPVIMAGDFNSVPNSYEYYHLGKNLQDAFEVAGTGSATSFQDYKFPIRIDYIFTSKSIQPISYKVDKSKRLSDHFPVVATFKIK